MPPYSYPPASPALKRGCLNNILNFWADNLEFYHPVPRTFLCITLGLLTSKETTMFRASKALFYNTLMTHMCWQLWDIHWKTFISCPRTIPNKILRTGGRLLWSLITTILSKVGSKIIFDKKSDESERHWNLRQVTFSVIHLQRNWNPKLNDNVANV